MILKPGDDFATESGINKNNVVSVAESLAPFAVSNLLIPHVQNININGENQFVETANVTDSPSSDAPATVQIVFQYLNQLMPFILGWYFRSSA